MKPDYTDVRSCDCGAITVTIEGIDYSMPLSAFVERYGSEKGIPYLGMYSNCNYCANNWGVDLCACGSGEKFDKCTEDSDLCGSPMQSIESEQVNVVSKGAWGR